MKICNVFLFLTCLVIYYFSVVASDNSTISSYPGSNEDVPVRQIHSHNDFWRKRPFYDAVEKGVQGIEADVWLLDDNDTTLYVGHHPYYLNKEKTLDKLYIQPILERLDNVNNPKYHLPQVKNSSDYNGKTNGVFHTNQNATLYFVLDVKTNGSTTWPKILKAFQPLREKGYLTDFNGTHITYRQVTVIGSGTTPLEYFLTNKTRDYFFEAQLETLNSTFVHTISPIAATNFLTSVGKPGLNGLNETALKTLESQIQKAHSLGVKTRYWNIPEWPVRTRNAVWEQMLNLGGDFLNTDNLDAAINF